jgi:hypothetical protein
MLSETQIVRDFIGRADADQTRDLLNETETAYPIVARLLPILISYRRAVLTAAWRSNRLTGFCSSEPST